MSAEEEHDLARALNVTRVRGLSMNDSKKRRVENPPPCTLLHHRNLNILRRSKKNLTNERQGDRRAKRTCGFDGAINWRTVRMSARAEHQTTANKLVQ